MNDPQYNACLFAIAAGVGMDEIMSLKMSDFNGVAIEAMSFFGSGLAQDAESSMPGENTES